MSHGLHGSMDGTSNKGEDTTVLTGRVAGQPALHRLLAKIRDPGLPLVSLNCVKRNDGEVLGQLI